MSSAPVSEFRDSLASVGVELTPTTAPECASTLRERIEPPAVGVALPFEGASLPDGVETDPTPAQLEAAATGVTAAGPAIADYGSVVIRPSAAGEEPVSLLCDTHVAVVAASDVVADMPAAFERLGEALRSGRGDAIIATGPSATADMGALVYGAHGPRSVEVVLLEDR